MYYNLNFNYGKVSVNKPDQEYVCIYNQLGKQIHCLYAGEIDIAYTDEGYISYFFGASGYRQSEDDSWTFCNPLLEGYVYDNKCYVVTEKGRPIDCSNDHALYEQLQAIIDNGKLPPKNNVFSLKANS